MSGPGRSLVQPEVLTSDTLEKLNPISALLQKRKDLSLSDQRIGQLGGVLSRLDAKNMTLLRQIDSVAKAMGLSPDHPLGESETDRERMQGYRNAILPMVNGVRDNYDDAAMEALRMFSGDTLRRANGIVRDARDKINQMMRGGSVGPPRGGHGDLRLP